jgi:hypothetical protein
MLRGRANPKYAEAFDDFGFDVPNGQISELSRRLKDSPVKDELIAALDDWALDEEPAQRQRLDQITAAVTGEGWREELSQLDGNPKALLQKTQEVIRTGGPPALFYRLARLLEESGHDGLLVLEAACRRYPSDFWLHFE